MAFGFRSESIEIVAGFDFRLPLCFCSIFAFPKSPVKVIIGQREKSFAEARAFNKIMMLYVLIGLSLSLVGVAGLQFFYLVYLERMDREQKRRIHELERHCRTLSNRITEAETKIIEQNNLLEGAFDELVEDEEVWADVIDER